MHLNNVIDLTDKEIDAIIIKNIDDEIKIALNNIEQIKKEIVSYKKIVLNPTRNILIIEYQNWILELEHSIVYMRRFKHHIENLYKED